MLLVGPAGAGKSTFAAQHFLPTEILSSDHCRALVSDDEADQSANPQAFAILRYIAAQRLRRGRVTVVDATNVRRRDRAGHGALAARFARPVVVVAFDLPLEVCLERNRLRPRTVDEAAVAEQWRAMPHPAGAGLSEEGFSAVHVIDSANPASDIAFLRHLPTKGEET